MAEEILEGKILNNILKAIPYLIHLTKNKIWLDYDREADVLYLHFENQPNSNHSEMRDDGIVFDYKDDNLEGITIPGASKR